MLLPLTGVVSGFRIVARRNLDTVLPGGSAFNSQTIADVHSDMTVSPNSFTRLNVAKIGAHIIAEFDHTVGVGIGYSIDFVFSTAISFRFITVPTPKNSFDKIYTIKTKSVGGRRVNTLNSRRLGIIAMVIDITSFVRCGHRRTKTTHHI